MFRVVTKGKKMRIIKESPACNKTNVKNWLFPKLVGKVSVGAYNLIGLETEAFQIYFNSNGIWDKNGKKKTSNSLIRLMEKAQPKAGKVL